MKTQAWGWLVAGVLAAGLNASYHDGGLQWAHEIVDNLGHRSAAVLALASGNAEQFFTEAQLASARSETRSETPSCPFSSALVRVQNRIARTQTKVAVFDRLTARQDTQTARWEANRDRMEARIEAQAARVRIRTVALNSVVVRTPQVSVCPRIRVSIPQAPMVRIPAPVIDVESGSGPI